MSHFNLPMNITRWNDVKKFSIKGVLMEAYYDQLDLDRKKKGQGHFKVFYLRSSTFKSGNF